MKDDDIDTEENLLRKLGKTFIKPELESLGYTRVPIPTEDNKKSKIQPRYYTNPKNNQSLPPFRKYTIPDDLIRPQLGEEY